MNLLKLLFLFFVLQLIVSCKHVVHMDLPPPQQVVKEEPFHQYTDYTIHPEDAIKHIGEVKEVVGVAYRVEVRKTNADSAMVMIYLGDANHPQENFISITKVNIHCKCQEAKWAESYIKYPKAFIHQKGVNDSMLLNMARGKIILFEGKPAIINNFHKMIVLEPVS